MSLLVILCKIMMMTNVHLNRRQVEEINREQQSEDQDQDESEHEREQQERTEEGAHLHGEDGGPEVCVTTQGRKRNVKTCLQDVLMLDIHKSGQLYARSIVQDYALRGCELESLCILDFVVNTYEEGKS